MSTCDVFKLGAYMNGLFKFITDSSIICPKSLKIKFGVPIVEYKKKGRPDVDNDLFLSHIADCKGFKFGTITFMSLTKSVPSLTVSFSKNSFNIDDIILVGEPTKDLLTFCTDEVNAWYSIQCIWTESVASSALTIFSTDLIKNSFVIETPVDFSSEC